MRMPPTNVIIAFAVGVAFTMWILPSLQTWWASRSG